MPVGAARPANPAAEASQQSNSHGTAAHDARCLHVEGGARGAGGEGSGEGAEGKRGKRETGFFYDIKILQRYFKNLHLPLKKIERPLPHR